MSIANRLYATVGAVVVSCVPAGGVASARAASAATAVAGRAVHLYRDQVGMAHVYAEREEDGFYGLGYALAEDRLLQVLTWYVAARGELAATFGPITPILPAERSPYANAAQESPLYDAIASDVNALKYRLLEKARRNLARLPIQLQKDLRGYVQGIAGYLHEHPERAPPWAPPLEAALPLALYHLQASEQTALCDARRAEDRQLLAGVKRESADLSTVTWGLGASNAWAVSGSRTVDRRVIMGSDSHGGIGTAYGTTFYPYRIKAGAFDVFAFDRPGTVNFLFGHSPYFAWGLTEGPRFVADCYRVKIDPKHPRAFMYDGAVKQMMTAPYRIRVKGAADITGSFEYTRHNGVLSPVVGREGDTAYVVSYAYADRIGLGAGEGYRIATTKTRAGLEAALAQRDLYPANLVIGGADGTIMYIRPGRVPIRRRGVDVRHTLDGNTSATAWLGIHSYSDLIKLINPSQGYISNSNVSPDVMYPTPVINAADFPDYFAFEPRVPWSRQQRIVDLLEGAQNLSVEGAKAILMDETIAATRPWGQAFGRVLADRPELLGTQSDELRPFIQELARFDGVFSRDSRGALYHDALRRVLYKNHPADMNALQQAVESGQLQPAQQALLVQAAAEAREDLLSTYGHVDLVWGDVHRIGRDSVDFPIGGGRTILGIGDRSPLADGAGPASPWPVRRAASPRSLSFTTDAATHVERLVEGQRIPFLVHFAAGGVESYAQALWGVSDDPASPHYADQCRLASEKLLRPIPLSLEALAQEHASETLLTIDANFSTNARPGASTRVALIRIIEDFGPKPSILSPED